MLKIRNGFKQSIIMWRYVLCFICCVMVIPNSWAKTKVPTSNDVIFTDAQKPILFHKPSRAFNIILKSNPTTGYIWVLSQIDSSNITPMKRTYYAPSSDTNQKEHAPVGAPGYEEWRFQLNKSAMNVPRLMTITFCMMRPWTINCDIKKTFTVIYTI